MGDSAVSAPDSRRKRLNWYLARSGGPSRRNADKEIEAGHVTVNGAVVSEMGFTVVPGIDEVRWNGRLMVLPRDSVVLALNKPKGYESTKKPRPKYPSVMDLVPADRYKGLVNVGRLDVATTGLLLFTNDGELCNRLTAPRFEVQKTYEAIVEGAVDEGALRTLESGTLRLRVKSPHSYVAAPAAAEVVGHRGARTVLRVSVHEGHYHEVRDLCKAVGHPVHELKRISFGPIELGNLCEGEWRPIEGEQLEALYSLIR